MPETEEEISRRPYVREELDRTAPRKQSKPESSDKFWFVIYLVVLPPRESGTTKSRLIKKILAALNADPSRVCFPAGANR